MSGPLLTLNRSVRALTARPQRRGRAISAMSKTKNAALAKGAVAIRKAESASKQSTAKVSWRDHKKFHPAADVFPLMSPDELRKLADDIQAHGIRVPIQTRTADDGELYLIDGRNRLDACELLGWQLVDDLATGAAR
jgi:hypothetical protein